jgi:sorbitol-specific phosphotransferase system component IIA
MLMVEGIYKDGKIELLEKVSDVEQAKVLITFLENSDIDLKTLGISENEAGELRAKFAAFDDWNDPALDVYNDYDNAKSALNE